MDPWKISHIVSLPRGYEMRKSKKTLKFAQELVAFHTFKPQADPQCKACKGTGEVEEVSHHNGDFYKTSCNCKFSNAPQNPITYSAQAELLTLAKYYIES